MIVCNDFEQGCVAVYLSFEYISVKLNFYFYFRIRGNSGVSIVKHAPGTACKVDKL